MNYYRYKNNYEKYVGDEAQTDKDGKPASEENVTVKTIASPRLMSKLSPVQQFVNNQGINVNPMSQKGLLKYALNKNEADNKKYFDDGDSDTDNDQDYSGFGKKMTAE